MTLQFIRSFILMIFLLGTAGAITEMLLLGHTGDWAQLAAIGTLAAALCVVGWYIVSRSKRTLRTFRVLAWMLLFAGLAGIVLHYRANAQIARNTFAGLKGLNLFRESMTGSAPILDPGFVSLLGLLGWIYTFRHPVLLGKRAIGANLEPDHTAAQQMSFSTMPTTGAPQDGSVAAQPEEEV